MKKLLKQIYSFLAVSGTGWLIDICIYTILTNKFCINVAYGNMISGIPALTFVFLLSTRKIFTVKEKGMPLKNKYIIYLCYQLFLILIVSWFGQILFDRAVKINWISESVLFQYLKLIIKIIITPITMTVNFIVMKMLSERL